MLDVLLLDREGRSVCPKVEIALRIFLGSARVVRAFKTVSLHTRDGFLFFEAPHVVEKVVDAESHVFVFKIHQKGSACLQEIAHQVDIGPDKVI